MSPSTSLQPTRKLYQGTIQAWNSKPRKLYQGTIQSGNYKPRKLYKGTIQPGNSKPQKLYQGTMTSDKYKPQVYGKVPEKESPYKYYELQEDYYGQKKPRDRVRHVQPAPPKQETKKSQLAKTNQKTQKKEKKIIKEPAKINQRTEEIQNHHVPEHPPPQVVDRQKTPPIKPPVVAAWPQQPMKSQSQGRKRTAQVSPFPTPSPEPVPRKDTKKNPEPARSQPTYQKKKPEAIFPPIIPVTMEDFVHSEQSKKSHPERSRGNALIPMSSFFPRSKSPDNFFRAKDDHQDSLSRSFTNVPGYNAVGSILRSMDMYY